MAKLEKTLYGDLSETMHQIQNGILNGSVSATLEDTSELKYNNVSMRGWTDSFISNYIWRQSGCVL